MSGVSLVIYWWTLFLIGTDLFVISPLLPTIGREMSVPESSIGWMVTAFALAYVIGGPRLGALADRVSRPRVLAASLIVFAAANGLTALGRAYWLLLLARGIAGFAASGVTPSVYGIVGTSAPPDRRATWLSIVTSGLLLALATGAPAGTLLATAVGWRGVFATLCGGALVVLAANLATTRGAGHPQAGPGPRRDVPISLRLRAVSVTGLWALAVYGVYTFLGTGLHGTDHFGSALIALALVLYGIGAVVGNLSGGPLADRFGGRRVTTVSLLALAAVEALLALLIHQRPAALAGLAALALAAYPYFSAHQTRLIASYGDHAASLMAWNNTAMYVGILLAAAVGGSIIAHLGLSALVGLAACVAALGAIVAQWAIPAAPAQPGNDREG